MHPLDQAERFENTANAREIFSLGRDQLHFRHRRFHRNGIRFAKVDLHQRMIAAMNLARFGKFTFQRVFDKLAHFAGNFVGNDGNDAAAAERNERHGDGVVAGKNQEILGDTIEDGGHLGNVAGGFLNANDIFDIGEATDGDGFDVHAGAALHAVKNDGQWNGGGDGFEMLEQAFLRGLVVVRRDGEKTVGADGSNFAGHGDNFGGVVTTGAGEHGNLSFG